MKHYTKNDFVVTEQNDRGQYGYCRKCKGDMQLFYSDNKLRHYNSHKAYKRLNPSANVSQLPKPTEIVKHKQNYDKATEVLTKMGLF